MHCCLHCGWNVRPAKEMMQRARFLPYVWMAMISLIVIALVFEPGANSRSSIIVVWIALAAVGLVSLNKLRRGEAKLANHSGDVNAATVENATLGLQKEWVWLLKTSPPRQVQLTNKGKRTLVRNIFSFLLIEATLMLCIAGNYWLLHKQHGPRAGKLFRPLLIYGIVVVVIYAVLYLYFLISYHRRARRLLPGGQAVIGKITKIEKGSAGKSILRIEFPHPLGNIDNARGVGPLDVYFEGMTLPVFCNPTKFRDSFALVKDGDYEVMCPSLSKAPSPLP